ncbi:glutamine amidotransferase [Candidatus Dojkabacteria bacterium]|uniref:Lipid II isoglutaminyl synthase (glutamine-hydrolyzing) subunit GatD n=1 Tax=Candidatus Dojkabacteria bacterium TaxID=2099670 RepID=A0A955L7H3_9BACT|nr:glutamine amidotransferase [Candidatus Dojkabacteria bacterium]
MQYELAITHLYPENLNLYGDTGNLIALKRRCEWLDIGCSVKNLEIGDKANKDKTDIYFMGGGQDNDQLKVVEDFHDLKYKAIKEDTENGVVFLGVCGGYQLMGHSFIMGDGKSTRGLGIINIDTKAPGKEVKERCIGNLIGEINEQTYFEMSRMYDQDRDLPRTLVGFENHSGQTTLNDEQVKPLAQTLSGFGNTHNGKTEGARYKNVFGSYMHGSFLPKNPHMADYLIWLALIRKYNDRSIKLPSLDDSIEFEAHSYIVDNYAA